MRQYIGIFYPDKQQPQMLTNGESLYPKFIQNSGGAIYKGINIHKMVILSTIPWPYTININCRQIGLYTYDMLIEYICRHPHLPITLYGKRDNLYDKQSMLSYMDEAAYGYSRFYVNQTQFPINDTSEDRK